MHVRESWHEKIRDQSLTFAVGVFVVVVVVVVVVVIFTVKNTVKTPLVTTKNEKAQWSLTGDPNNLHFGREFFTCNYVLRSLMLPLMI